MKYPYIFALATFLLAGCEDETTVITNNIAPSISVEDATVIEKAQIDMCFVGFQVEVVFCRTVDRLFPFEGLLGLRNGGEN